MSFSVVIGTCRASVAGGFTGVLNGTGRIEIFIDRQNQIRFHNRFLFSMRAYCRDGKCTPLGLAFALQKLFRLRGNLLVSLREDLATATAQQ
jgi:hypothetical protein